MNLSVCIPIYNGALYLEETIKSVLKQDYADYELIIVDDKSKDSSLEIAQQYARQDKKIRVVRNESNLGLVGNWNRCIELARGEWIKFVFQDDLLEPDCLAEMVAAAETGDEIIACRRTYLFEGASEEIVREYGEYENTLFLEGIFRGKERIAPREFAEAALRHLGINFVGEPTSVMLHRSVFKKYGFFNSNFVHLCDLEYWMRVATNAGLVYVPKTLATFRVHNSSESAVNRERRHFRAEVLDPLLLIHEYVQNTHYEVLRSVATEINPPVDLDSILVEKAFWACSTAASLGKSAPSAGAPGEWKSFVESFPQVEASTKYKWLRLRGELERRLLWRFNKGQGRLSSGT